MINNKKVSAIILAAGNSSRYGNTNNKNYDIINNKPVIEYSIDVFNNNIYVDELVIAIKNTEQDLLKEILINKKINKNIKIVIGGKTRKESVYNCLNSIDSDIVIIHDGARPLIIDKYINECIEHMNYYKGVTVGVKSKDTVKITNDYGMVINTTNRDNTWLIQTPQCFDKQILLDMHNKYIDCDVTDDCSLLEKDGYNIKVIEGDYSNIKITTRDDLSIVKKLVKKNNLW